MLLPSKSFKSFSKENWIQGPKCFASFLYIQHPLQTLHPLHRPDEMGENHLL